MTTAWDRATTLANRHTRGSGVFIRLQNDGDSVIGAFVGEPASREVHWTDGRAEECSGAGCAHCRAGARPSLRVLFNFYVPAESAMKVIEGGTAFFASALGVRDKFGLDKWLFEVKRVGRPKDPKTTYTILPERPIDDALAAQLRTAPRHALETLGRGQQA